MTWTLIMLFSISSFFSADMKITQFPMASREACTTAKTHFEKDSKGIKYICLSNESGEVVK